MSAVDMSNRRISHAVLRTTRQVIATNQYKSTSFNKACSQCYIMKKRIGVFPIIAPHEIIWGAIGLGAIGYLTTKLVGGGGGVGREAIMGKN